MPGVVERVLMLLPCGRCSGTLVLAAQDYSCMRMHVASERHWQQIGPLICQLLADMFSCRLLADQPSLGSCLPHREYAPVGCTWVSASQRSQANQLLKWTAVRVSQSCGAERAEFPTDGWLAVLRLCFASFWKVIRV